MSGGYGEYPPPSPGHFRKWVGVVIILIAVIVVVAALR